MQNPFETGHIKNYVVLYVSVVIIMILFFFATSLFHDVEVVEQRVFEQEGKKERKQERSDEQNSSKPQFKLLEKGY
ncbi:MAG: hypothetical protein PHX44_01075 [Sulfurimonas sp.]|uniref:hypothetical protein n=1 Tax=Sulfurimonas sp. TaxID=2022749 RepID=UPI0026244910|nr:hypothetical protein [Sulfurimonas sp.]MDD2651627.1 hypothetical protein [Sulfurimonas sp.]MDD3451438.1 hypothetical protein [Sulfurimonas sp.]